MLKPTTPVRLTRRRFGALAGLAVLTGCGGGGGGWFRFGGQDVDTLEPEGGYGAALSDPRPLAPRVDEMVLERATNGLIVRTRSVMPTQEYWDVDLVPASGENPRDGVLRLDLRAWPPVDPATAAVGPAQARTVTAAAHLTQGELDGVRTITVAAQSGVLSRAR